MPARDINCGCNFTGTRANQPAHDTHSADACVRAVCHRAQRISLSLSLFFALLFIRTIRSS